MSRTFLDMVVDSTRERVALTKCVVDVPLMQQRARQMRDHLPAHRLRTALERGDRTNIIAEIKRASPSKGEINPEVDVAAIAAAYQSGGAAAISVLTEPEFFRGSPDDLIIVGQNVSLPVLRKDFIVDEYQIFESAALGADAILLIVAALPKDELLFLKMIAEDELGIDALVEVHTSDELAIANAIGATIIGINNRDLHSLDVSLDVSRRLVLERPANTLMIAESGISTRAEIDELKGLGFNAFLIGETLMRSGNIANDLKNFTAEHAEDTEN
jgi:indole-3-glycerol phosphate synthase